MRTTIPYSSLWRVWKEDKVWPLECQMQSSYCHWHKRRARGCSSSCPDIQQPREKNAVKGCIHLDHLFGKNSPIISCKHLVTECSCPSYRTVLRNGEGQNCQSPAPPNLHHRMSALIQVPCYQICKLWEGIERYIMHWIGINNVVDIYRSLDAVWYENLLGSYFKRLERL